MWNDQNMKCPECEMTKMWNDWMWNDQNVKWLKCEMTKMWNDQNVKCPECEMTKMWNDQNVKCLSVKWPKCEMTKMLNDQNVKCPNVKWPKMKWLDVKWLGVGKCNTASYLLSWHHIAKVLAARELQSVCSNPWNFCLFTLKSFPIFFDFPLLSIFDCSFF